MCKSSNLETAKSKVDVVAYLIFSVQCSMVFNLVNKHYQPCYLERVYCMALDLICQGLLLLLSKRKIIADLSCQGLLLLLSNWKVIIVLSCQVLLVLKRYRKVIRIVILSF